MDVVGVGSGRRGSVYGFCPNIAECEYVDIGVLVDDIADFGVIEIYVFVEIAENHIVIRVLSVSVERVVDLSDLGIVFVFGLWRIPIGEIPFDQRYVFWVFLEHLEGLLWEIFEFAIVIHIEMVDAIAFIVMIIKWE